MNYSKVILDKVEIVNEVLNKIKALPLLENPKFLVDEMSTETWLRVNSEGIYKNHVPVSLTFTLDGLEIKLDRVSEAIDWSNEDLKDKIDRKILLKSIFTDYILVEYKGAYQTNIIIFDSNGVTTNKFKYHEGFSLNKKRSYKLYFPMFRCD